MKKLSKYLPFIIVGGISYFLVQRYVFGKGKTTEKDKMEIYYKKLFGDREKQIQQESPEKSMFNIR